MGKDLLTIALFGAALAAAAALTESGVALTFVMMSLYAALLSQAWNILGGYGGQLSFGHALFFGVGAYAQALGQLNLGINPWLALPMAIAAWETYERLGSPEGELALAQLLIYLATAPKSNSSYVAYGAAKAAAKETGSLMPPKHILNAPTKLMKDIGYSKGYAYDHDTEEGFSGQNYFPDGMPREKFYNPVERGFEREISKRLEYWEKLRKEKS